MVTGPVPDGGLRAGQLLFVDGGESGHHLSVVSQSLALPDQEQASGGYIVLGHLMSCQTGPGFIAGVCIQPLEFRSVEHPA